MNDIEIFSLCVKIVLFINKNYELKRNPLLYLISLSDFYFEDTMLSKNIKNINSLNYYVLKINDSLACLLATNMIVFHGESLQLTSKGKIFVEKLLKNSINKDLLKKVDFISKNFNCDENLDKIYDELVNRYIKCNLGGRMKINYIILKGDEVYNLELNKNLNIITDYSGAGKTLLFKFIEFVLGSDGKHINFIEANKIYPGLEYIEMSISKGDTEYKFKKCFENKNEQVFCNDKLVAGDYNQILNEVINYNPIKVIKNNKMEQVAFTLREYIKTIFFNEAKLTSDEPLLSNNYSERSKLKIFTSI